MAFKLTYATMFNPPEELHTRFEDALKNVRANLGKEYGMIIDGKDYFTEAKYEDINPANTDEVLAVFQKGNEKDAATAIQAAQKAFPIWAKTPWQERVRLMRRVAELLDERIYEIGAIVALEVGKNRMEALGDVAETADLIRYACDQMDANDGFIKQMGIDPLSGYISSNRSMLRPYGVWLVISPFNFPAALTGGLPVLLL
jgi:1-pyrroline-5-carboxylate dehydrogenase